MNIQQLQYILAVAEYQHFELSAEKCCVTQSTLSTMISKFEEEIGLKIFDRKHKPVRVTEEGKIIIAQLRIITAHIDELQETIKTIKGETKGVLQLSIIPTVAPYLLYLFVQDFATEFPEVKITIKEETTSDIIRQIKSRELDIGIVSIPLQEKDIVEIKLYDEAFVFYDVTSTESGHSISVSDIDTRNLCLLEEGHCLRTQVMKLCEFRDKANNMYKLNFEYKVGSMDSLLRFVKANQATTLVPYLATVGLPHAEKKHIKAFHHPVPFRQIGLVVHRHFVKKKILQSLQTHIQLSVANLLPQSDLMGIGIPPV